MGKRTTQEDGFAFKFLVSNLLILVFCLTAFNIRLDLKVRRFQRRYHSYVTPDLKNAYTAAQAYFTDYPDATVDLGRIVRAGFRPREGVEFHIVSGNRETFEMEAYGSNCHPCSCFRRKIDAEGSLTTLSWTPIDFYPRFFDHED